MTNVAIAAETRDTTSHLVAILRDDPLRWRLLDVVRRLDLPDCWVAAGCVRNAVWDHLHRRNPSPPAGDVDVIWFDRSRADPADDQKYEAMLRTAEPSIAWSVKNQARMHIRNQDAPYTSSVDAMRFWPETATAVAARRCDENGCDIAAPLGLDDLFSLRLRPALHFVGDRRRIYDERLRTRGWIESWPRLRRID